MLTNEIKEAGENLAGTLSAAQNAIASADGSGNYIRFTKATRVSPSVILDRSVAMSEHAEAVLEHGLDIFTAYYLQAARFMFTVASIDIRGRLDALNPERDIQTSIGAGYTKAMSMMSSSYDNGLPLDALGEVSMEGRDQPHGENLSVGKIVDVVVKNDKDAKASFPVMVRLATTEMLPDVMSDMMAMGLEDTSFKARRRRAAAGEIRTMRDLLLGEDLAERHLQNLIKDKSGYYRKAYQRRRKNVTAGIVSQEPSIGTASSIFVMSQSTKLMLERKLKGRLSDFKVRERIFEYGLGMLIMIYDPDAGVVTTYHREIEEPTTVSIRSLTRRGSKDVDMMEIFQMMTASRRSVI